MQIKFVQDRDGGIYECQVSTSTGTISRRVHLNVVYPEAYIKGGEEYHVDEGSPISLTCVLDSTPTPPQYIFWYHNDRMVNYHVERGVKVTTYTTSQMTTESKLTFSNASKKDEGNYTCSPSNSVPATVHLYVTKRSKLNHTYQKQKLPTKILTGLFKFFMHAWSSFEKNFSKLIKAFFICISELCTLL